MSATTEKCYSLDDESFLYDEFGDLLDAMACDGDVQVGDVYYEADKRNLMASDLVNVSSILSGLEDSLYDEVGEIADSNFEYVSDVAKAELRDLLVAWIDKHVNVGRYWMIEGKTREMRITPEDLADANPEATP